MFITWDDVGRTETPGWVTVRGRIFEVKQEHIAAWKEGPDGAWTLVRIGNDDEDAQWVLDAFDPSS